MAKQINILARNLAPLRVLPIVNDERVAAPRRDGRRLGVVIVAAVFLLDLYTREKRDEDTDDVDLVVEQKEYLDCRVGLECKDHEHRQGHDSGVSGCRRGNYVGGACVSARMLIVSVTK